MYLSARARLIIEQLMLTKEPVSIKTMAQELAVSERTIRRDLKEVKAVLKSYELLLIGDNQGLSIQGTESQKQKFKWQLLDLSYNEYSPEERQQFIIKELIKNNDVIKLISLANDLGVTVSTISNDLTKIEHSLPEALEIARKKGQGVSLIGPEFEKRQLMSELFGQQFPKYQLLQFFQNQEKQQQMTSLTESRLLFLSNQDFLTNVENNVRKWRKELPYEITDEAYVNLVIHLAISVERIIEGQFVQKMSNKEDVQSYPEFQIAKELLAACLEMEVEYVPLGEAEHVTMHLRGTKAQNYPGEFTGNEQMQAVTLSKQLITSVQRRMGKKIPETLLLKGLTAHLRPTLRRLNEGMSIRNPLIQSIKRDYANLFEVVRAAFDEVYSGERVPDEEIGYLVLHFGAALLQLEETVILNGLVVCASGIGTSRMLVTRLRQAIPQLKKLKTVSLFELPRELADNQFDLIVSTIDLGEVDFNYFHVSPMLSDKEISQIEVYLQNRQTEYSKSTDVVEQKQQLTRLEAIHTLENQQLYTQTIIDLLKGFKVSFVEKITNGEIAGTLRAICTSLLETNPGLEVESVISSLLVRENWSGFGIPQTNLALFHARNESVHQPIFQVFPLSEAITMPAMGGGSIEVKTIVLLLVPEKMHHQGLEVMSSISAMLIESQETVEILQSRDSQLMTEFVVTRLTEFISPN